jgi:hypothetical protein
MYDRFFALAADIVSILTILNAALRLPIYFLCNMNIRNEVLRLILMLFRQTESKGATNIESEQELPVFAAIAFSKFPRKHSVRWHKTKPHLNGKEDINVQQKLIDNDGVTRKERSKSVRHQNITVRIIEDTRSRAQSISEAPNDAPQIQTAALKRFAKLANKSYEEQCNNLITTEMNNLCREDGQKRHLYFANTYQV